MTIQVKDITKLVERYTQEAMAEIDLANGVDDLEARIIAQAIAHLEVVSVIIAPLPPDIIKNLVGVFLQGVVDEHKRYVEHAAGLAANEAVAKAARQ